jgi:S-adenosylmethionine decarboxylase
LTTSGIEWVIDATGCDAESLRDASTLERLFEAVIAAGRLTAAGPAVWHRFPHTGGLTGLQILTESHLTCHTFPENGSLCLNVFCCVPREEWHPDRLVAAILRAQHVHVRRLDRQYGAHSAFASSVTTVASS